MTPVLLELQYPPASKKKCSLCTDPADYEGWEQGHYVYFCLFHVDLWATPRGLEIPVWSNAETQGCFQWDFPTILKEK